MSIIVYNATIRYLRNMSIFAIIFVGNRENGISDFEAKLFTDTLFETAYT